MIKKYNYEKKHGNNRQNCQDSNFSINCFSVFHQSNYRNTGSSVNHFRGYNVTYKFYELLPAIFANWIKNK